jgi:hypothetical protein
MIPRVEPEGMLSQGRRGKRGALNVCFALKATEMLRRREVS